MAKINQPDETQGLLQAPVRRLGDDDDRRVQLNTVPRDGVIGLAVDASAVEFALQVRDECNMGASLTAVRRSCALMPARSPGLLGRTFSASRPAPLGASLHQTPS